jgi:hypothetical protein
MLGHLRSKALESFKSRLEQSLNKGEGFAASVRTCTHSSLLEFDQGCSGSNKSNFSQYSIHILMQKLFLCQCLCCMSTMRCGDYWCIFYIELGLYSLFWSIV